MSSVHQVFLAVIRRFLKANFKKSIVLSYDMQSVLIGSEYPVMDTLLFSFAVMRQISIDTFLKVPLLLLVTLFLLQLLRQYSL